MKQNVPLYSFNRGEISRHALGRLDVESMRLAAEQQVNWMPMVLGPMMLRPGLKYLGSVNDDAQAVIRPFIFATNDTAILEFTDQTLRIWVDDALLTVESVSTSVTNGDFSSSTGWTLSAGSGASATISSGVLSLHEVGIGSEAYCERSVSVSADDQGVVHRLRIVVNRGPVGFQIGSTSGDEDLFVKTELGTGTHSIAFTPTTSAFVPRLFALGKPTAVIDSMQIESSGTFELTTPWRTADLSFIRHAQSGDVVYIACEGYQQRQIERRDNNSWSIVLYEPIGGPYQSKPGWATGVSLTPVVGSGGTGTLTSNIAFFKSTDINSIIAVQTTGVGFKQTIAALDAATDSFEVNGINVIDRLFFYTITGTWSGTITIQRSTSGPDHGFANTFTDTTSNVSDQSEDDSATHANRTVWYRAAFTAYSSGSAVVEFHYQGGSGTRGQARIIDVNTSTEADIEEFDYFENTSISELNTGASKEFRIADWSNEFGWPSAVEFHDGRLWWAGRDKIWGSVSDDYKNFEETFEGEAGPINRSFGYGPFANVNWMMSLQRLIVGRDASCVSVRSSAFDAPLTPVDFTMRDCSTQGAATALPPVKLDTSGIFVDKSGRRVHELRYDVESQDYRAVDLTLLNPDIGLEGFVDLAAQRQLDTRIHFVRGDGAVAVLSYEKGSVEAWWRIETDGDVESVCVLPGELEDSVYYVVKRTKYTLVGGELTATTVRYLEKFARQDECEGDEITKLSDSHIVYTGAATTTITGLSHLEGREVVVWGNGKDLGEFTVSGGQISGLSESVESAVVGLEYSARFKSTKLAFAAVSGTALSQKKRVESIGLILADTHYQGVEFGQDFDTMDFLPQVEEGQTTPDNTIWTDFDAPMMPLPGAWKADSRLCLRATAPRPATVIAAAIGLSTHEKT